MGISSQCPSSQTHFHVKSSCQSWKVRNKDAGPSISPRESSPVPTWVEMSPGEEVGLTNWTIQLRMGILLLAIQQHFKSLV